MSRVRVIEIMRRGPRGAPGDMDPAEWDALQAELDGKADLADLAAKLNIADVLNEPDMATGATDKPPSQASVVDYLDVIREALEWLIAEKLDDTLTPSLLLSPDGSRDRRGSFTPTTGGTVGTAAGQYGQAWDLSGSGYLSFATSGRVDPAQGTILMRINIPTLSATAMLYDGLSSPTNHRMFLSSARNLTTRFGPTSRASGLIVPTGSTQTVAATWGPSGHRGYLNGTEGPIFADTAPASVSANARIGQSLVSTFPFPGLVESVLIYDQVLTAAQIASLSSMPTAWTWDTARLPTPEAAAIAAHTADTDNPHQTTKDQVGLGNADNTTDLDKPISHAAQAAFDAHAGLIRPDVMRYPGDVLWESPIGPLWMQLTDILNDVWDNSRFGYGPFGEGPMPE